MRPPAGWFVVAYSSELHRREVMQVRYFGEPLLLCRAADGVPVVLGARHGFLDGIPRGSTVPQTAVRSWPVSERNGLVLVHFHPGHAAPTWEVPELAEYGSPAWTPYATRRFTLHSDVHEVVEPTFPTAHEWPDVGVAGADFRLRTRTEMDTPFGRVPGMLDIQSYGFGLSLVRFTGEVETLLITTVTPIDEERVDARYSLSVKRLDNEQATRAIEQCFIDELERQVQNDIDPQMAAAATRPMPGVEDGPDRGAARLGPAVTCLKRGRARDANILRSVGTRAQRS
jgi:hypothetical protein